MIGLVLATAFLLQSAPAEQTCDKPYRLGHFVRHDIEDLRVDRHRAATKKQLKELDKQQAEIRASCDAFVSEHPNRAVSKEFFLRVPGLLSEYERCESFCGTEKELLDLVDKETKETDKK